MYFSIAYLSLFVSVTSWIGLISPRYTVYGSSILPSGMTAMVSLITALFLLNFSIFSYLRDKNTKITFKLFGFILTTVGVIGFLYPTYFGLFYTDVNLLSLIIFLINGVTCLVAGFERERVGISVGSIISIIPTIIQKKQHMLVVWHRIHDHAPVPIRVSIEPESIDLTIKDVAENMDTIDLSSRKQQRILAFWHQIHDRQLT
ncbi:MAG TPA: hypothetical protein VMR76_03680 [Candidatus Saccharimonadia bacterium]|nr:hypothetical protein [Candidatus Saccharimonadia bacterium]